MTKTPVSSRSETGGASPIGSKPPLSPAAERALNEARERRAGEAQDRPVEVNGRGGLEPIRYGDWEVKGLASDF